jgi:hypothetical protein
MSFFCTELSGIVAVLYVIHHICNCSHITTGMAVCYSNNEEAKRHLTLLTGLSHLK